jgi:hypothetical protein
MGNRMLHRLSFGVENSRDKNSRAAPAESAEKRMRVCVLLVQSSYWTIAPGPAEAVDAVGSGLTLHGSDDGRIACRIPRAS